MKLWFRKGSGSFRQLKDDLINAVTQGKAFLIRLNRSKRGKTVRMCVKMPDIY